ncbi:uncharacterized protein JN550_003876 [Neoarthrinium moseri]|uniref:uncharacterized protein n=1 Tax=Neoarthrinium moseri TaxID=1658444 RepID=UPI001FDAE0E2|nr:uncharacterized protein JN550_003876 [Neoarthrinium moseri]KAI1873002.1 hypothetical protein JN550_003876 [Neoarthrinium moseri]
MWFSLPALLAGLALPGVYAAALSRSDIQTVFSGAQWSSAGTIVSFPGSDSFTNATERWSVFHQPTYAASVSPATEADVAKAVTLATSHRIPFLATGGRHGYTTTLGELHNGLAIDLGQLNTVNIDKSTGVMTIGGAVRFSDIYNPVFEAGYEIQTGTCSCPGMVGVTLGGGVGPWAGVHGLDIDALLSLRVVTANGTVIDVSDNSNPDLFWAMRGAGANFGVVTSATYQLQPLVNDGQIWVAEAILTPDLFSNYFKLVETYDGGNLKPEMAIIQAGVYDDAAGFVIAVTWSYLGPEDKANEFFKPLLDLNPIVLGIQNYQWNNVIQSVSGGSDAQRCIDGAINSIYTIDAKNFSAATYETAYAELGAFYEAHPEARGSTIQISIFPNQAALAVPDDRTAYPWRETKAYIDLIFTWTGTNQSLEKTTDALGRQWRSTFAATSGYPGLAAYVNSAHGDESLESRYGANKLPRLAALKKTWDPNNVFRFNNKLPTKYP